LTEKKLSTRNEIILLEQSYDELITHVDAQVDYLEHLGTRLSHELRTPVSIIRSSLEHLTMRNDNPQLVRYIERAEIGAAQLNHIFQSMTEARDVDTLIEHLDYKAADLGKLLNTIIETQRERRDDITIVLLGTPAQLLKLSPTGVAQSFSKVIANAVDFATPNTTIEIDISVTEMLELKVTNKGPLINPPIESIFDSFVSNRANAQLEEQNLGFGLYICRKICLGLGGNCTVENNQDGVSFYLSFPTEPES